MKGEDFGVIPGGGENGEQQSGEWEKDPQSYGAFWLAGVHRQPEGRNMVGRDGFMIAYSYIARFW